MCAVDLKILMGRGVSKGGPVPNQLANYDKKILFAFL